MDDSKKINGLILLVIHSLGIVQGRTYLQKIFFLIEKRLDLGVDLNYIKYHYGPFSRELMDYVNNLSEKGLLEEKTLNLGGPYETHTFELTKKGKIAAEKIGKNSNIQRKKIEEFCDKFRSHSPSELLRFVYDKYPQWTTNSVLN